MLTKKYRSSRLGDWYIKNHQVSLESKLPKLL